MVTAPPGSVTRNRRRAPSNRRYRPAVGWRHGVPRRQGRILAMLAPAPAHSRNRGTRFVFLILLALLATLAPCTAAEVADFKQPPFWPGWKQVADTGSAEMQIRSWLPAGETPENWRQALNIYTISPRPPGDAAAGLISYMTRQAEIGCRAMAVAPGETRSDAAAGPGGYAVRYAQLHCPLRADGSSRVDLLKAVAGADSVTLFVLMRQGPSFALNPPAPPVFRDPADLAAHQAWLKQAGDYLRDTARVCRRAPGSLDPCSP